MKSWPSLIPAAALMLVSCAPSQDEQFLSACEGAIKDRLVAPSAYRRISVSEIAGPTKMASAAFSQYALSLGRKLTTSDYDQIGESSATPAIFERRIEYDAPNSFNVPIRSRANCLLFAPSGKISDLDASRVAIKAQ